MKGTKIVGMVLAVAVMIFMIAPFASAQTNANILNDKWFKVKLGLKGYVLDTDEETVLSKGSGSDTTYLHLSYAAPNFTVTTCMQDDLNGTLWHKNSATISTGDIYGATYPQIWDFDGTPVRFSNGDGIGPTSVFDTYPTLYMKISVELASGNLKNATISTLSCGLWAELDDGTYAIGSCTFSGSLVKVLATVPGACH
jgi:hypothetical protein